MKLDFNTQKHLIHNADVLLFRSKPFPNLGWWISKYTNSIYSHTALAYWERDELYCLEFREFKGSRQYPIIEYLKNGDKIDVFRASSYIEHPQAHETPNGLVVENQYKHFGSIVEDSIIHTAKALMNNRYSMWTIWQLSKNYIPFLRLRQAPCKNGEIDPKSFVCSTLVTYSYRINYMDPVPLLYDSQTTPGDIARSAIFHKLFEITFDK